MKNRHGFSVIEGLIVLVVVGFLGGVGWYVYNTVYNSSNEAQTATQKSNLPQSGILESYNYENGAGQRFKINFYKGSSVISNQNLNTKRHDKPHQTLLSPLHSSKSLQLWLFIGAAPYFPSEENAKKFYETLDNCAITAFTIKITSLGQETKVCSTPDSYYNGVSYNMPFYFGKGVYQATIGLNAPDVSGVEALQQYDQDLKEILSSIEIE